MSKSKSKSSDKNIVYLETSTLLPLLYITPYTNETIKKINKIRGDNTEFYIHVDCLKEIRGRFENNSTKHWRDDPVYRYNAINSKLVETTSPNSEEEDPNSAIRILLDGDIGDLGNFNRFQVLFYLDLVLKQDDEISSISTKIEERRKYYINKCDEAIKRYKLKIDTNDIISGWGNHYLESKAKLNIEVNVFSEIPDIYKETEVELIIPDNNNKQKNQKFRLDKAINDDKFMFPWDRYHRLKLSNRKKWTNKYIVNRDSYHFQCTMNHASKKKFTDWNIIIADGGFKTHLKNERIFHNTNNSETKELIKNNIILTNKNFNTFLRREDDLPPKK